MLCGRRARVRYDNSHRDRPPRRGQPHCMNHGRLSVLMRMVLRRSVVFSTARECGRFRGWRAVSRLGLQVEHRRLRRTTKAAFRDIFPSLSPLAPAAARSTATTSPSRARRPTGASSSSTSRCTAGHLRRPRQVGAVRPSALRCSFSVRPEVSSGQGPRCLPRTHVRKRCACGSMHPRPRS